VQAQIQVMLDLQEAMNTRVHADWRQQGFEWYRAIWVECAELMDHYGWKWWKKQSPDIEQVRLELIDIWHFGLSILLIKGTSAQEITQQLKTAIAQASPKGFHLSVEAFAGDTLLNKDFSVEKFACLLSSVDMDVEALYVGYIGKNVLNFFRQDHGYQEGSYQKIWGGQEDNEHLVDIVKTLDSSTLDFKESLYRELSARYQHLCG
jgi:dimeric dUTPase (all-alpha-NTP-PPase superfamily)